MLVIDLYGPGAGATSPSEPNCWGSRQMLWERKHGCAWRQSLRKCSRTFVRDS